MPTSTHPGHISKYIAPGAKRIGWSKYGANLDVTAAVNPDGDCTLYDPARPPHKKRIPAASCSVQLDISGVSIFRQRRTRHGCNREIKSKNKKMPSVAGMEASAQRRPAPQWS
ncbi:MAG: glycoside hydrolase family 30 beta sandwich domain-containing protein [Clostridia bacterium]